ncbi:hypothetical protein D5E78_07340 [Vibrio parahaemolyticus]|nr:hypothetical protein D5E78_07340 [Vibrio parahaemolyticus]
MIQPQRLSAYGFQFSYP